MHDLLFWLMKVVRPNYRDGLLISPLLTVLTFIILLNGYCVEDQLNYFSLCPDCFAYIISFEAS